MEREVLAKAERPDSHHGTSTATMGIDSWLDGRNGGSRKDPRLPSLRPGGPEARPDGAEGGVVAGSWQWRKSNRGTSDEARPARSAEEGEPRAGDRPQRQEWRSRDAPPTSAASPCAASPSAASQSRGAI